jgi:hypothetical protein
MTGPGTALAGDNGSVALLHPARKIVDRLPPHLPIHIHRAPVSTARCAFWVSSRM